MDINSNEFVEEKVYLSNVLNEIRAQLNKYEEFNRNSKLDIILQRKSMWEELPHSISQADDIIELSQADEISRQQERDYFTVYKTIQRLKNMISSPYFGRLDFLEKGQSDAEKIYIGVSALIDEENCDMLVYDWRAPISGMFYDYEIEDANYKCPSGIVKGKILLKRQYEIKNSEFKYIFNCSLKINDEILKNILSKNTDNKMKNIVSSIQREQNKVIRDDNHDVLIVQGAAGSGKTSIALHRIAYLLYKYKSKLKSNNIVIFSPNQLFNDYISDVIPELGEDNAYQTTFREYSATLLSSKFELEDMSDQIEYLLKYSNSTTPDYQAKVKSIEYKASLEFANVIEHYVKYLEAGGMKFKDILHKNKVIISSEDINMLFLQKYKNMKINNRLLKIKENIFNLIDELKKERKNEIEAEIAKDNSNTTEIKAKSRLLVMNEFRHLYDEIERNFSIDLCKLYYKLFADEEFIAHIAENIESWDEFNKIAKYTLKQYDSVHISYEDVAPLLLLKELLGYGVNTSQIKYVILDEAQDYTPIQYILLKQLFPNASMTILGDLNQCISLYGSIENYSAIINIFNTKSNNIVRLNKCYRSTKEIFEFSAKLLSNNNIEYFGREGEKPKIIKAKTESSLMEEILEDITKLTKEGMESIAVICKTSEESLKIYEFLRGSIKTYLFTKNTMEFKKGIIIVPSYLSKGLEFDAVIAYNINYENYHNENEKKLLYVTITRALHRLHIYYLGKISPFIERC